MNTSLKRLEASFQGFTDRILNTKVIKGILDFGNTITSIFHNITDQLGSTGATGVAGAGLFNHFLKDRSK